MPPCAESSNLHVFLAYDRKGKIYTSHLFRYMGSILNTPPCAENSNLCLFFACGGKEKKYTNKEEKQIGINSP